VLAAMKIYNAWKAMQNIALLRDYDARQKGARGVNIPDDQALQELLYKLMH
jgi:DNA polymerase-3 subunit delta